MLDFLPKNPLRVLVTIAYILLGFLLIAYAAPKLITYFLPFMVAGLISLAIKPIADVLEKLHIHRRLGVILAMLFVIGIIGGVMFFLIHSLVGEIRGVLQLILESTEDGLPVFVRDFIRILPDNLKTFAYDVAEQVESNFSDFVYPTVKSTLAGIGGAAVRLPSAFVFTIALVLAIYFISYDGEGIKNEIKRFVPAEKLQRASLVKNRLSEACGGYIKAQLILMTIVFCILLTGFLILDVDFALLFAFVISLWDTVPFLGTGIILNPWAVINLLQGDYFGAAGFFILYLIVLFTRQILEPKILSGQLGMHPVFTLMSIYIGLKSMGIVGMIIGPIILIIIINTLKIRSEIEQEMNFDDGKNKNIDC